MNTGCEFGDYRIIYELNQKELIILVTKTDNIGQVYKWIFKSKNFFQLIY